MPMHAPSPEPELAHDELANAGQDANLDPWSTGFIVFSLGPDFEGATLDRD